MIKVFVGNNIDKKQVIVDENTTLRTVLEDNGVNYKNFLTQLDGDTVSDAELDQTFAEHGKSGTCFLLTTTKVDNA